MNQPLDGKAGARIVAAALAGALGALAVGYPRWAWLAWVAMVPFFRALRDSGRRLTLVLAIVYTVVLGTAGVAPWLTQAAARYFDISLGRAAAFTVPSLVAVWTLHGAALGALLLLRPERSSPWAILWYASVWVCWEAVRTVVFPYYPAVVLGVSQYEVLPVLQLASVCGVAGITYAIIACNAALATVLPGNVPRPGATLQPRVGPGANAGVREGSGAAILTLATGLAVVASATGLGAARLAMAPPGHSSSDLEVGLVDVAATTASARSVQGYLAASQSRGALPSTIVWPESALPTDIERDRAAWRELARFTESRGTTLIAGGPGSSLQSDGRLARFNSVHVLRPAHGLLSYHKRLLVPFAERWPALLGKAPEGVGHLAAGRELSVFDVDGRRFGVLVCFEITDGAGARALVHRGASFIVNPTNDAWFTGAAPHLPWAAIRAVESGLPVVRAANAGVSAVVDRYGYATLATTSAQPGPLSVLAVPEGRPTFYARVGDVFLGLCAALVLVGALMNRRAARIVREDS